MHKQKGILSLNWRSRRACSIIRYNVENALKDKITYHHMDDYAYVRLEELRGIVQQTRKNTTVIKGYKSIPKWCKKER